MSEPKSLQTEEYREYTFPGGAKVRIDNPVSLIISDNGHRVADANNDGHYIPNGWIHLFWKNKEGAPAIAF